MVAGVILALVVAWFLIPRDASDSGKQVDDLAKRDPPTSATGVVAPAPRATPEFSAKRVVFHIPEADEMSDLPSHPLAEEISAGLLTPAEEPAAVLEIFGAYRNAFGSYPSGEDNVQLMNALRGGNAGKRAIFARASPRLNAEGALLDGYGTPFFFHLLSSQAMEVRSAGEDRQFYTPDDVVAADRAASTPALVE